MNIYDARVLTMLSQQVLLEEGDCFFYEMHKSKSFIRIKKIIPNQKSFIIAYMTEVGEYELPINFFGNKVESIARENSSFRYIPQNSFTTKLALEAMLKKLSNTRRTLNV